MASPAAQLVEFIARAIVTNREAVAVRESDGGRMLELETAEEDRGRVIGRQGRVAKAVWYSEMRLPRLTSGNAMPNPR